jgi:hypothetical protein
MPANVPANVPAPNPNLSSYERTTQAIIFNQVTANQAQVGTAAPAGAKVYGMAGVVARGQLPYNLVMQCDVGGTGSLNAGLTVTLLGSLDGLNFYSLGSFQASAGAIQPFSGILARYLTASVSEYSAASGAPSVTVSFSA